MAPKGNTALYRDKKKKFRYAVLKLGVMPNSTYYNCLKYEDADSGIKHKARNHFVAVNQQAFERDFQ